MLQKALFQMTDIGVAQTLNSLKIQIHKSGYYKLYQLITLHEPQLMSTQVMAQFKRQLGVLIFQFTVSTQFQQWNIRRTLTDFLTLHKKIRFILDKFKIKLQVVQDNRKETMETLQNYLNVISQIPQIKKTQQWQLFIQISDVASRWQGKKFRQTYLRKRAGGRYNQKCCNCGILFGSQKRRYFIINSEGVYYYKDHLYSSTKIKDMLAFNFQFNIKYNKNTYQNLQINLISAHRQLEIICESLLQYVDLILTVKEAMDANSYLKANRFGSFAPVRNNSYCKFLIDGKNYFQQLYQQLKNAQKHVYITDWWLSPQFYLIRPASYFQQDHSKRIDHVLQQIAKKGVQVCIILYHQPKIAINNDSFYSKQTLQKMHPNIKVLRHPNYLVVPILWSHHQKIVIIDQRVAFMGGLDICYGRMDNFQHPLTDCGIQTIYPGVDYVNFRAKDIYNPRAFYKQSIDRKQVPRMPWHDVGIKLLGGSVTDLTRHFVQYWNFVNLQIYNKKQTIDTHIQDKDSVDPYKKYLDRLNSRKQPQSLHIDRDQRDGPQFLQHSGFQQPISPSSNHPEQIQQDFLDMLSDLRQQQNLQQLKMPQHDMQLQAAQDDIRGRNNTIFNFPKIFQKMKSLINSNQTQKQGTNKIAIQSQKQGRLGSCQTQILRSASSWSIGLKHNFHQMSIHIAYIQLIAKAKQFIYIQNQFFISSTAGDAVKNKIAEALIKKIKKAAKNNQQFKVIVFIPLLPGFEGQIDDDSSQVFRIQLYWQYQTISRGGRSIYQQLKQIPNAKQYISFYGLRNHAQLNQKPVTQIVYIHTKLMIIDDQYVIMGSANINDRSLLGDRDSQMAIVVKDDQTITSPRQNNWRKFAHQLRVSLMSQHFGLDKDEVKDYFDPALYDKIAERTSRNYQIYKQVFGCYPDCDASTFAQMYDIREKANNKLYNEYKKHIKGYAVPFPLNFMRGQDLTIKTGSKQSLVPMRNFT